VVVVSEMSIPAGNSSATIRYRVTGAGELEIDTEFRPQPGQPEIPRIGYQCRIPTRTPVCRWHGRGPHENYVDRHTGSWTTIHEALVETMFHRYTDPQESGNRTGIRWAALTSPMGGSSLRFDATGEHMLEMSVYPCSPEDITLAMHPSELPRRDYYTLNIDHRHSGLGGSDSWGALALPQYRIPSNKNYRWSFRFNFAYTAAPQPKALPRRLPPPPGATEPPEQPAEAR
jgi:beta-galactosidase